MERRAKLSLHNIMQSLTLFNPCHSPPPTSCGIRCDIATVHMFVKVLMVLASIMVQCSKPSVNSVNRNRKVFLNENTFMRELGPNMNWPRYIVSEQGF